MKDIQRTSSRQRYVKKLSNDPSILKHRIDNLISSFSGAIPRMDLIEAFEISSRQFHRWCKRLQISTPKGKKTYRKGEVFKIYYFVQACINLGLLTQPEYEKEIVEPSIDFVDWYKQQKLEEEREHGKYEQFEFLHTATIGGNVQPVSENLNGSRKNPGLAAINSND